MRLMLSIFILGMFVMFVIGAIITKTEIEGISTGMASLTWPKTLATITKWNVEILGGATKSSGHGTILTCEYTYVVAGEKYKNNRVASYPLSTRDIDKISYSANVGSFHEVYYASGNPQNAVLINGWSCWMLLLGLAFLIGSVSTILILWKFRATLFELWKQWPWFSSPK
ncbi:MAG: DUF3592 domain-containing protein [Verrucomicrobiota bacterium]